VSEPSAAMSQLEQSRRQLTPEMFINRELSWLEFNRRVLEESENRRHPLLERVKFAAIFSSNLNEFFMIRVAGVRRKIVNGVSTPGTDGRTPTQTFAAVRSTTQSLLDQQAGIVRTALLPELAAQGITIHRMEDLSADDRNALSRVFERDMFPILTPQAIDRGRRFPHVSNRSLNLIVALRLPSGPRFARIKIPATLPRLVAVPQVGDEAEPAPRFVWLEDVVAAHLSQLFTGATVLGAYPFHVTRDSDIELDEHEDDHDDLMMTMRESIAQRAFGPVVRLMVDTSMPEDVRSWLEEHLHATQRDVYVVDAPLALEDLFELAGLPRPDLKDAPFEPAIVPAFAECHPANPGEFFAVLRERDVLVHHPYQTFATVADFVRAASTDPDVVAIKQTLYRIGRDSPLIPPLIAARDDDTQVAVLVELKARFDEENNITWAEQLERHGVHVAYGLAGLKTHCKATLVVRREPTGLRRYVHLATGNYNASTARIYEDLGVFSSREDLGSDLSDLFNVLTGYAHQEHYRSLWVAPDHLRNQILAAIDEEIVRHGRDGDGAIVLKVNAIVDRAVITELYRASQAGVKVDLLVRGACSLRPGVPGWSENIRVRSVVGRFLEHSRIYVFGSGDQAKVRLGSADIMERNFDRRVEVVFPVEDPEARRHILEDILPAYWRDTVNARDLQPSGEYVHATAARPEDEFDVQRALLRFYRREARKAT